MKKTAFKTMPALAVLLYYSLGLSSATALTGTLNSLTADAQVDQLGTVKNVSAQASSLVRVGNNSSDGKQQGVVHVFQIPAALLSDPTLRFDTATYTVRLNWTTATTRKADLYGLGYRVSSTVLLSDTYVGALDAGATLIKDDFLVPSLVRNVSIAESGTALVDYLNSQLVAARAAGAASAYVFLRTSPDASIVWQYYELGMGDSSGLSIPTLAYTTAPIAAEPAGTVIMISSLGKRAGDLPRGELGKVLPKTDGPVAASKTPNA